MTPTQFVLGIAQWPPHMKCVLTTNCHACRASQHRQQNQTLLRAATVPVNHPSSPSRSFSLQHLLPNPPSPIRDALHPVYSTVVATDRPQPHTTACNGDSVLGDIDPAENLPEDLEDFVVHADATPVATTRENDVTQEETDASQLQMDRADGVEEMEIDDKIENQERQAIVNDLAETAGVLRRQHEADDEAMHTVEGSSACVVEKKVLQSSLPSVEARGGHANESKQQDTMCAPHNNNLSLV